MSPPPPRVNTFVTVKNNSSADIDNISKVFIITQFLMGINRISVLSPAKQYFLFLIAGLISGFYLFLFYHTFTKFSTVILLCLVGIDLFEYTLCSVLCYVLHKKLLYFYLELNKFDKETGFQKKNAINKKYYIINIIHISITICLVTTFPFQNPHQNFYESCLWIVTKTFHCLEFNFFAHLFILIIPRVKCIYRHMTTSYPKKYDNNKEDQDDKENMKKCLHVEMNQIMDFYNRIVIAFEYLNEAIRCQMLLLIMTTFSIILCFTFLVAKTIISDDFTIGPMLNHITVCIIHLGPLLAPCVYAESICSEVRQLKEYVITRIFENTLDKSNRSTARAFIMLIEKRNLSFSLFGMFFIDISLPCKFIAVWLTYLVMILQFDKVVNSGPK